jgi:hypothetical protein
VLHLLYAKLWVFLLGDDFIRVAVKSGFSAGGISVWACGENLCADMGSIGVNCTYGKHLHFVDTNFKYRNLRLSANHSFKSTRE